MENKLENNPAISFLNEMVDSYNTGVFKDEEIIFELYFKDLSETYQLLMTPNKCKLKTEDFSEFTTKLETNFEKYSNIIKGKMDYENEVISKKDFDILGHPRTIVLLNDLFRLYNQADSANTFLISIVSNYKVGVLEDEEIFIEIYLKDLDRTYYIVFTQNDCVMKTKPLFTKYDTRIETELKYWIELCQGGSHMDFLYSGKMEVKGDPQTLLKFAEVYDIVSFQC